MNVMLTLFMLLSVLFTTTPMSAQDGMVKGMTKDRSMKPLANVRIALLDSQSDTITSTLSKADGRYEFEQVSAGMYTMVAELAGYEPLVLPGIHVLVNKISFVDVKLTYRDALPEKGNVCKWRRKG